MPRELARGNLRGPFVRLYRPIVKILSIFSDYDSKWER